jgi:hypothetical protein
MGVVAGLVLVAVSFYGWVQYRQSQYEHREQAVLSQYHDAYTLCVTAGNPAFVCANRAQTACQRDPFWATGKPFAFDPHAASPDPRARCAAGVAAG